MRKLGGGGDVGRGGARAGKSSGESEGSPDQELFSTANRKKPGTLTDNFTRQRSEQNMCSRVKLLTSCRSLSNSGSSEQTEARDAKKGNIRKERAKKLKGNMEEELGEGRKKSYHYCQHCM